MRLKYKSHYFKQDDFLKKGHFYLGINMIYPIMMVFVVYYQECLKKQILISL